MICRPLIHSVETHTSRQTEVCLPQDVHVIVLATMTEYDEKNDGQTKSKQVNENCKTRLSLELKNEF